MIYEFSNFVDNYSNADGESRERMAVSQYAKILGQSPKTIKVALQDAGIIVPANATREDLTALAKQNATNKKLKYHLGTLIVAQAQAEGENLNLFGTKADGTQRSGTAFFKKIGGIFKKKNASSPKDGSTPTSGGTEKKGFFKRLFGSTKDAQGNKQPSKFGSWFNKNSEAIGNIGSSLLGGLFGGKDGDANQQANTYAGGGNTGGGNQGGGNQGGGKAGMGKKILIGVIALAVIGGIVYFVRKKKK